MRRDAMQAFDRKRSFSRWERGSAGQPLTIEDVFVSAFNMGWKAGRKRALREYFGSLLATKHPAQQPRKVRHGR